MCLDVAHDRVAGDEAASQHCMWPCAAEVICIPRAISVVNAPACVILCFLGIGALCTVNAAL